MKFQEFDQNKSEANKSKHGISFDEANELLQKSQGLLFLERNLNWTNGLTGKFQLEGRGKVLFEDGAGGYWLCIYTDVGPDLIRPISVHRLYETRKGGVEVDVSNELVEGFQKIQFDPVALKSFWNSWSERLAFRHKRNADTKIKLKKKKS